MKKYVSLVILASALTFFLAGCTTLDSLNPFVGKRPKLAELQPIKATADVRVVWHESVGKADRKSVV